MQNKDRDEQMRRNGREFRREPDTTGRFDAPETYERIGGHDDQRMNWTEREAPSRGSHGARGGDRMRFDDGRSYRGAESWGYGGERGEDGYQRSMRGDIDRDRGGMRNQPMRNDNGWSPYNEAGGSAGGYYGRGEFRQNIGPRHGGGYDQGEFHGGGYQSGGYQGGGYQGGGYDQGQFQGRSHSGGIGPRYGRVGPHEQQGFYAGQNRSGQYGGGNIEDDGYGRRNPIGGGDVYGGAGYGSNAMGGGINQQCMNPGRYDRSAAFNQGRGSFDPFGGQPDIGDDYGGQSFRGVGPKNYNRSPDSIRNDLCERLTDHPGLNPSRIEVDVEEDGVVHLKGQVDSRRTKRMIEAEADHIRGVVDVRNELEIEEGFYRTSDVSAGSERQSAASSNGSSEKSNGSKSSNKSASKDSNKNANDKKKS